MATTLGQSKQTPTRIFLSYSRKDKDFVVELKHALERNGYEAFLDTEDISGGEEWQNRLDELIIAADAVAFVISPDSVASPICDWETKRALELRKRLVPLLWRPLGDERPPAQLSDRNYIFFDQPERFASALTQLCNACDVDIAWVRKHTRLVELSRLWDSGGRKRDLLLRGEELRSADTWASTRTQRCPEIPPFLTDFLLASRQEEGRAVRSRRTLTAFAATAAIAVITIGAGWFTQDLWRPVLHEYQHYKRYAVANGAVPTPDETGAFQDCEAGTDDCPAMLVLPAGQFLMGSLPRGSSSEESLHEGPITRVSVDPFAVSKYAVTVENWRACVAAGGCRGNASPSENGWEGKHLPVTNVSWEDGQDYVRWLSEATGQTYRLLTNAEWEYAARGVTSAEAPHTIYPWGDTIGRLNANWREMTTKWSGKQAAPVGSFPPNAFGLYDIVGNVSQWVEECWHETYLGAPTKAYPAWAKGDCSVRTHRGGSWLSDSSAFLRTALRERESPTARRYDIGLRIAREVHAGVAKAAVKLRPVAAAASEVPSDTQRKHCINEARVLYPRPMYDACNTVIRFGNLSSGEMAAMLNNRAQAAVALKYYGEAFADIEEAVRLDPTIKKDPSFLQAYRAHATILVGKEEYGRAVLAYDEALEMAPGDAAILNERCWARAVWGQQLDLALADCNASVRIRTDPTTLDSRGLVHMRKGDFQSAFADYNAAVRTDPKLVSAVYGRGLALLRLGRTAEGAADIAAANAADSGVAADYAAMGLAPDESQAGQ